MQDGECLSIECGGSGMCAQGGHSKLESKGYTLRQNVGCGVVAADKRVAVVRSYSRCSSSGNGEGGYMAVDYAQMEVKGQLQ